jgi:methyl-accepting chemotaxis protein
MNNFTISKKISIGILVIAIISFIISFLTLTWHSSKMEKVVYNQVKDELNLITNDRIASKKDIGMSNAVALSLNKELKVALDIMDRKLAYKSFKDTSAQYKANSNFKNIKIHIHTKDVKSFLRVWKPKYNGDDLSGFRHSINEVSRTKKPVNTFEVGRVGLTLRSIMPIFNKDKYVGSLEFIQGINSVAKLFDKYNDEFLFLMDKHLLEKDLGEIIPHNKILNDFIISQKFIKEDFLLDAKKINFKKLFEEKILISDEYFYTYIEVKDFKNKKVAIFLVARPLKVVKLAIDDAKELINIALILISGLILFILIIALIGINKLVIVPIARFQNDLIHFFKFLNKETSSVKELEVLSSDEIGQMTQVINKNITKAKSLILKDDELISDVKRVVSLVKEGNLKQSINKSTTNRSLEELKLIFNDMLLTISNNIAEDTNNITKALDSYSKLDFRYRIKNDNGKTAVGLNNLADVITTMLVDNKKLGILLNNYSSKLSYNVNSLNTSSVEQAASLEQTAASIEEITSLIKNTATQAQDIETIAYTTKESDNRGKDLAKKTANAMDEINNATTAIEEAITIIDQIAFQTNILSLNAAVEAATAGEAGKGFAVVAGEVRNLAARSAEAASEIKSLVDLATQKTNEGKLISSEMLNEYDTLDVEIIKTTNLISSITISAKEQLIGIKEINTAISQLDITTQNNASMAIQTDEIAKKTDDIAKQVIEESDKKEFHGKNDIK